MTPNNQFWPKRIVEWHEGTTGYMSVPFTWLLPAAQRRIRQRDLFTEQWIVGGPAVRLMPDYPLDGCGTLDDMPGVLQRVNPLATRTTTGCVRRCRFCGIYQIEPKFGELPDWPDLPVLCDNNLLAASEGHFRLVMERLVRHKWCDFSQGLDCRLLAPMHAGLLARLNHPIIRLALDNDQDREPWAAAVDRLRTAGIAKSRIRSYVLCGFVGGSDEDWDRCRYVESFGLKPLPMWFHPLDTLVLNPVTDRQRALGWTHRKRRELMCWYYQHRTLNRRG